MEPDLHAVAFRAEDDPVFRMCQVLLLLRAAGERLPADRLTYYDFFADHPYLLFEEDSPERVTLRLAGFESTVLSYRSSAQRFVTRQERVNGDLAKLIAYGLAEAGAAGGVALYSITARGESLAGQLRAMYAEAYSVSAALVVRRLRRLSNRRLHQDAQILLDPPADDLVTVTEAATDV